MTTGILKLIGLGATAIGLTSCRDRDIDFGNSDGQARTVVSYPVGQEQEGTVVPWAPPSAFEIEAMARLKTMVPGDVYDSFVWERETNAIVMRRDGLSQEVKALYAEIQQDRIKVLEETRKGSKRGSRASRRRATTREKPPAL